MTYTPKFILTLANRIVGRELANSKNTTSDGKLTKADTRIIDKIIQSFSIRSRQDIATWRTALAMAENINNPLRTRLYALYKDVRLDDQVDACIKNLKAAIKSEGYYIGKKDDKERDDTMTELLERPWFFDFIDQFIDSVAYGYVLLESGEYIKTDLGIELESFNEVPREHVIPERGIVILKQGDDKGIDFTDAALVRSVFSMGKKNDLGFLNNCAPKAIVKKNTEAAWAEFCEIFGMPLRVGKVASRNQSDLDKMEYFLKNMGSASYAVTGIDDIIEFAETTRGDSWQVYDKLMERQDKAIAKIILGQTMTTDNGSSRSQAEVHERIGDKRMHELKLLFGFVVNFKLFPFLIANGYKLDGYKYYWEMANNIKDIDISMDEFLSNTFEFDNLDYFKEKYRVPIKSLREDRQKKTDPPPTDKKVKGKLSRIELLNASIEQLYTNHSHD